MTNKYLLDNNVALRLTNPSDDQHKLVTEAIVTLLKQGHECYLTPQVLIEFWAVATRPVEVNGLELSVDDTRLRIDGLLNRFPIISTDEVLQIFPTWLNLVTQNLRIGKRVHDTRLIAVMLESGITHVLTFNVRHFSNVAGITVVHPNSII